MAFCSKCGTYNQDSVPFCTNCGAPTVAPVVEEHATMKDVRAQERLAKRNTPVGVLGWMGYSILFAIPIVNLIVMILILISPAKQKSLKNYIIATFIMAAIVILVYILLVVVLGIISPESVQDILQQAATETEVLS